MTRHEFIFSDKLPHRVSRHLVFWLVFALHTYLFRYYVGNLKYLGDINFYVLRMLNLLLFFPGAILYAYFALYFLLPRYILTGRYGQLVLITTVIAILLVFVSYLLTTLVDIRLSFDMPLNRATIVRQLDFTLSNGLVYPLTVSGFAIGIKMAKNFYLQQKQNELLARQKIKADVLLLKSEVHPRFLFHSLNNIYQDMRKGSAQSPDMLLRLSDLLSYILYESGEKEVPLKKELSFLQNYIELEQPGWGGRLSFVLRNKQDGEAALVAPLILLPVLEYVFEEGDKNAGPLLITLDIFNSENKCRFFFTISGPARPGNLSFQNNIQLQQVQKRLQVVYPGRHRYAVEAAVDAITITLSIEPQTQLIPA